jgi:hypothetical protein
MRTLTENSSDQHTLVLRTSSSLTSFPSVQSDPLQFIPKAPGAAPAKNVDFFPQSMAQSPCACSFCRKTFELLNLQPSNRRAGTSHLFSPKSPAIPAFPPNPTSLFSVPLLILHFEFSTLNFFTSHQNVDSLASTLSLRPNLKSQL